MRYQQLLTLLLSKKNWSDVDHKALCTQAKEHCQPLSIDPFDEKVTHVFLQTMQNLYPDFLSQEQSKTLEDLFAPFGSIDLQGKQPTEKGKKCL